MTTLIAFEYDLMSENGYDHNSEAIETLAYDRNAQELYVEFVSGGTYVYTDVAESTYNLFAQADSLGAFYRKHIQGTYTSEAVNAELVERSLPESSPAPSYAKGDRVFVNYPAEMWHGPGTVEEDYVDGVGYVSVRPDATPTEVGGFYPRSVRPLDDESVETVPSEDEDPIADAALAAAVRDVASPRWAVKWTSTDYPAAGPFEPEFEAWDEADVLDKFGKAVEAMETLTGKTVNYKIVSVTHYLD